MGKKLVKIDIVVYEGGVIVGLDEGVTNIGVGIIIPVGVGLTIGVVVGLDGVAGGGVTSFAQIHSVEFGQLAFLQSFGQSKQVGSAAVQVKPFAQTISLG